MEGADGVDVFAGWDSAEAGEGLELVFEFFWGFLPRGRLRGALGQPR